MRKISVQVPILLGVDHRQQYIMGSLEVIEDADQAAAELTLTASASGINASDLIALMDTGDLMALQFIAIPVTPRNTQLKENTSDA